MLFVIYYDFFIYMTETWLTRHASFEWVFTSMESVYSHVTLTDQSEMECRDVIDFCRYIPNGHYELSYWWDKTYAFPSVLYSVNLNLNHVKKKSGDYDFDDYWFSNSSASSWSIGDDSCSYFDRSFAVVFAVVFSQWCGRWNFELISRNLPMVMNGWTSELDRCLESWIPSISVNYLKCRVVKWRTLNPNRSKGTLSGYMMTVDCDWFFPFIIINDTLSDLKREFSYWLYRYYVLCWRTS